MKIHLLAVAAVLLHYLVCVSGVELLDRAKYHELMNTTTRGIAIVSFCTDQHAPCRRFQYILDELEVRFRGRKDVRVARVEAQTEWRLVDEVGIRSFPGLLIKQNKRIMRLKGDPSMNIVKTIEQVVDARVTMIATKLELEAFLARNITRRNAPLVPVVVFSKSDDSPLTDALYDVENNDEFAACFDFAITSNPSLLRFSQDGVVEDGSLEVYRPDGWQPRNLKGTYKTAADLMQSLARSISRPFEEITEENAHRIHLRKTKAYVYAFLDKTMDNTAVTKMAEQLAVTFESRLSFGWYDYSKMLNWMVTMGLSGAVRPALCIVQHPVIDGHQETHYYPLLESTTLNSESITAFLESFEKGNAQRYVLSEPVPTNPYAHDEDGFLKAVGYNIEEIVLASRSPYVVVMTVTPDNCPLCNHTLENLRIVRKRITSPPTGDILWVKIDTNLNALPARLTHDVLSPGFVVIDNVKNQTTIAKGRKVSVASLNDFFSTFFEIRTEGIDDDIKDSGVSPPSAIHEHCYSARLLDSLQKQLMHLEELKKQLAMEYEITSRPHPFTNNEL